MMDSFYDRPEWKRMRYKMIRKYGGKCMACGRGSGHGVIIQVDHIQPKSIYPELALREDNLQVLCKECNMGKSNKFADDYRPKPERTTRGQDEDHLGRLMGSIREAIRQAEEKGDETETSRLMMLYVDVQRHLKNNVDSRILLRNTVMAIIANEFKVSPEEIA